MRGEKQENKKEADWLWGKHWEQGGANEADAGQVWREKQTRGGEQEHWRETNKKHKPDKNQS